MRLRKYSLFFLVFFWIILYSIPALAKNLHRHPSQLHSNQIIIMGILLLLVVLSLVIDMGQLIIHFGGVLVHRDFSRIAASS